MSNTTFISWKEDPAQRGTAGLIWSCVVTLALCVWSALHLNIPAKGISTRSYYLGQVKWVVIGILAPEVVVWTAWRQSHSAKLLTESINLALHQKHPFPSHRMTQGNPYHVQPERRHVWTDLHSFYVIMGGLVIEPFDPKTPDMSHLPRRFERLTLTPQAAIDLAEEGLLPDLDPNLLKDKSKSNAWAKMLVMIQALWFILQVLARLFKELPVSLLELNTSGHVLCALVVYFLWWDKPIQVNEPTVLRKPWVETLCTAWFMLSRVSGANYGSRPFTSAWVNPELEGLIYVRNTSSVSPGSPYALMHGPDQDRVPGPVESREGFHSAAGSGSGSGSLNPRLLESLRYDVSAPASPSEEPSTENDIGQILYSPRERLEHPHHQLGHFIERMISDTAEDQQSMSRKQRLSRFLRYPQPSPDNSGDAEAFLPASHNTSRRHALCAQAIQTFPSLGKYFKFTSTSPDLGSAPEQRWTPLCEQLLVVHAMNWPSDVLLHESAGWTTGTTMLWVASFIYANIHLLAWNEIFPNEVECLLWRVSSTYIGGSGVLAMVFCSSWRIIRGWRHRFIHMKSHIAQYVVFGFLVAIAALCYILARLYLTVEGFVGLRHAPTAMYDTVRWAQYLPHF